MKLRPYQERAINLIRDAYKKHERILVMSPTGSGKTEIIFHLIKEHKKNGLSCLYVVRRRQIIFQTYRRLKDSGVNGIGILMYGQDVEPNKSIQICSIDTIHSRISLGKVNFLKYMDAVFVDEAHDTTSDTYQNFLGFLGDKKKFFGFTATPYRIGKKTQEWWDTCIVVTTTKKLVQQKFLCPAKLYVPCTIDTSRIKVEARTGDYNMPALYRASADKKVMGKIVEEYQKLGKSAPAVCFAVNRKHSMKLARKFREAGIDADHVEHTTKQEERDKALYKVGDSFVTGKPYVLCNVNIFSTGVDLPELTVGIMARPTESRVLWVQQIGRLLRPREHKSYAIIIDHGGNSLRFGDPLQFYPPEMNPADNFEKNKPITVCPACFYYHDGIVSKCLGCGEDIADFRLSLSSGDERKILTDESTQIVDYDDYMKTEMGAYVKINVRYALNVLKKSEKDSWYPVYKKYGEMFLKHYQSLGCPDYVAKGFRKDHLLASVKNIKVIYADE